MQTSVSLADAAARGDLRTVGEMLRAGVDVHQLNGFGRAAIQVMQMGNPAIAQLLLENGANPNMADPSTGSCPAHDAAREGFLDTLLVLLDGGASLNGPLDNYGKRPIDVATNNVLSGLKTKRLV
ncbi:cyclin-dependent kinase 4 inhibitor B [Lissotriton helveticus]